MLKFILILNAIIYGFVFCQMDSSFENVAGSNLKIYHIEGKVFSPGDQPNWQALTKISLNGNEILSFVKVDGTFTVYNVSSGSYLLEVINSDYTYEPVRVEINSRGKFRARKVNFVQVSQVIQEPYPLKMKPLGRTRYFQQREQWRITDFLFNPMVLMMILPFALIMLLPKLTADPETKKEMEQFGTLTNKFDIPEMSEVMTSWFSNPPPKKTAAIKNKKQK